MTMTLPMHAVRRVFFALTALLAISCGSGSNNPNNTNVDHIAQITSDEQTTTIQFIKIIDSGSTSPTIEVLQTSTISYGIGPFFVNNGSVPKDQPYVPPECIGPTNLTPQDLINCWAKPTLATLQSNAEQIGLDIATLAVVAEFPFVIDDTLPQGGSVTSINDFATRLDAYATDQGFKNNQIFDDEPIYAD